MICCANALHDLTSTWASAMEHTPLKESMEDDPVIEDSKKLISIYCCKSKKHKNIFYINSDVFFSSILHQASVGDNTDGFVGLHPTLRVAWSPTLARRKTVPFFVIFFTCDRKDIRVNTEYLLVQKISVYNPYTLRSIL